MRRYHHSSCVDSSVDLRHYRQPVSFLSCHYSCLAMSFAAPECSQPVSIMPTLYHTKVNFHLTLTPLNFTKHYCRKCKNWSKSDYVIDTGPIQVRNRWSGSVTGVAWHGWSRDWCARSPGINSGGNHHF